MRSPINQQHTHNKVDKIDKIKRRDNHENSGGECHQLERTNYHPHRYINNHKQKFATIKEPTFLNVHYIPPIYIVKSLIQSCLFQIKLYIYYVTTIQCEGFKSFEELRQRASQARLPVAQGGVGLLSTAVLAPIAFLGSFAITALMK